MTGQLSCHWPTFMLLSLSWHELTRPAGPHGENILPRHTDVIHHISPPMGNGWDVDLSCHVADHTLQLTWRFSQRGHFVWPFLHSLSILLSHSRINTNLFPSLIIVYEYSNRQVTSNTQSLSSPILCCKSQPKHSRAMDLGGKRFGTGRILYYYYWVLIIFYWYYLLDACLNYFDIRDDFVKSWNG